MNKLNLQSQKTRWGISRVEGEFTTRVVLVFLVQMDKG